MQWFIFTNTSTNWKDMSYLREQTVFFEIIRADLRKIDQSVRQRSFCYCYKLVSQAANAATHWHWRMYLRGEGNWHTVRLLRGKQALDWRLERISVRHSVPARLRVQVTEGQRNVEVVVTPLSSVSRHTVWAVFGPKVPGESFIWVAATCYYLCERTCKCILVRL